MTACATDALAHAPARERTIALPGRVAAVDVLRGLVLVLLLPDLAGGFSFYRVAQAQPDAWIWQALATQFQHVAWTGAHVWDLVMPLFVFLVGVSMALSQERRRGEGDGAPRWLAHVLLRAATLFMLGMLLQFKPERRIDELLPLLVLLGGLHWGTRRGSVVERLRPLYAVGVLVFAAAWMAMHPLQWADYQFGNQILVLIGIAYVPAALLSRCRPATQVRALVALVALYGIAFLLYEPPAGAVPLGEALPGLHAHWNNGTNLGAAVDRWLYAWLPRVEPYADNPHGYHTLQAVPLIALMLAGALAGRALLRREAWSALPGRFARLGLLGLALAWLLAETAFPLVKSLSTPSWVLFSVGVCLLLLAGAMRLVDAQAPGRASRALGVLGRNSLLLYVLAYAEAWRIEAMWQAAFGRGVATAVSWWPVLQSCLVLATLWGVAVLLGRARLSVRL